MRSSNVNTPSVPKNAAHIFAPAAMAAAVIIDVPPPVTPPYTSTTIGAEEMMDTAAIIIVENNHFHHVLNIFFLARNPVTRPASILTGINAKFTGFAIPVTTFVSPPAVAPTHGPQSIAAKIVPIVSRYIGSFNIYANCPPTKLTATATGIIKIASIEKSSLTEYFLFSIFSPPKCLKISSRVSE